VQTGPDLAEHGVIRWRRIDLSRVIEARFGVHLAERSVGRLLRRLGFRRLLARPRHIGHDSAAQTAHKKLRRAGRHRHPEHARGRPIELWWQDEARIGQQGTLTRLWARRGSRPPAPRDCRYEWAYIFGTACPLQGKGAAFVLPRANASAMNMHLKEISLNVARESMPSSRSMAPVGTAPAASLKCQTISACCCYRRTRQN
jgi:hypothetical protein